MSRATKLGLAVATVLASSAGQLKAGIISTTEYSLTSITGSYAWGQTDWNDVSGSGFINNVSDISAVSTLLSNGYASSPPGGTINGIYNWPPDGIHALTFQFNSGNDYTLDSLSFISSRSYGSATPISIDYSLNGGPWIAAVSTTSGALGIVTGAASTYTVALGGVQADAFRFTTTGGDQISLHEIWVEGSRANATATPEPAAVVVWSVGAIGMVLGAARRRGRSALAVPV